MTEQVHKALGSFRLIIVIAIVLSVACILLWRAIDLHVFNKDFLQSQGNARYLRHVPVVAHRGLITDRNGEPLAVSTPVDSVWVNPAEFISEKSSWLKLANTLSMNAENLQRVILQRDKREFLYIKRHINPELSKQVSGLDMPGVYLQREYRRYYPAGEVMSHVIGFTDIDDRGQEGIELAYDEWLRGKPGQQLVIKDRLGQVIKHVESVKVAEPGNELALSIDRRLQYLAYRELKRSVYKHKAKSGSAVILDSRSGQILAMVNQPSYNPNNRKKLDGSFLRNRAITDVFEPGSTIKPFTVAAALESGRFTTKSVIDTSPGIFYVGKYAVKDVRNYGRVTIPTILTKSSNIGASKLALAISAKKLSDIHMRMGFGVVSGSGFPGEVSGILNQPTEKQLVEKATLAYGYGLSVTPLQLARAYSVIANNGRLATSGFVLNSKTESEKIITKTNAIKIRKMLESVVSKEGTGYRAKVSGYSIAGKTGTVKKANAGGYSDDKYIAVFAGIAPASDPRLVMVVTINEPNNNVYYGGEVAAPVFSKVMSGALRLMDIPPDDLADRKIHLAELNKGERL